MSWSVSCNVAASVDSKWCGCGCCINSSCFGCSTWYWVMLCTRLSFVRDVVLTAARRFRWMIFSIFSVCGAWLCRPQLCSLACHFEDAAWATTLFVHLLGIVVTTPILLAILSAVAIVHKAIQDQARRRPGTLNEQQFAVVCKGEKYYNWISIDIHVYIKNVVQCVWDIYHISKLTSLILIWVLFKWHLI